MVGLERRTRWSVAVLAAGLLLATIGLFPTDCLISERVCSQVKLQCPRLAKSWCQTMSGVEWRMSSGDDAQSIGIGAVLLLDVLLIAIFVLWRRAQENKQPASP